MTTLHFRYLELKWRERKRIMTAINVVTTWCSPTCCSLYRSRVPVRLGIYQLLPLEWNRPLLHPRQLQRAGELDAVPRLLYVFPHIVDGIGFDFEFLIFHFWISTPASSSTCISPLDHRSEYCSGLQAGRAPTFHTAVAVGKGSSGKRPNLCYWEGLATYLLF